MEIKELVNRLNKIKEEHRGDTEVVHIKFDELLLEYIGSDEVRGIYKDEDLWYS